MEMKKRVIATILAGAAMLGIVACATLNKQDEKQEVKQENVDMKNPITKCNSLEELNEKMAIKLCAPGVMGVNDIAYQIIDNGDYQIGEYIFEVAGKEYDFRNASTREDISGIYINGENAFNKEFENGEEIQYASSEEVKAARWFTLDGQYCLSVKDDNKMSMDDFKSTVNEALNATLTRTVNTSVSTLLPMIAIAFFGGESIRGLAVALILGIVIGTYASIMIGTP
ncbi:MAG: hypothetical protein HUJ53_03490, partial [Holdemanella sp.]|nr:hypothetical protein [Holdemanella sp.]